MVEPISNASCPRTNARKTGMRYTEPNRPTPKQKLNTHPIAKDLSLNVDSCTMGWTARNVRQTKNPPVRALRENKLMQMGENQPSCGDCLSPISRHASAAAIRNRDKPSSLAPSKFVLFRGKRYGVTAQATSPGMTLIRNSQCQEYTCVIQPPTTGPTVGASTAMIPAIVVAMPCVRGWNKMNTAANTVGISVPPANPCTTRNETSIAKLSLAAHPIDAKGKNAMAAVNSQRIESICVSQPVSGIAMISAIK